MTSEAVIECVKEYPILYDMTRPDYKDQKRIKCRMRLAKSSQPLYSSHFAWRKAAQYVPVFQFAVRRGPCVLVLRIEANIRFLRVVFNIVVETFFFSSKIRAATKKRVDHCTSKFLGVLQVKQADRK
jgi:hypothetical protein